MLIWRFKKKIYLFEMKMVRTWGKKKKMMEISGRGKTGKKETIVYSKHEFLMVLGS